MVGQPDAGPGNDEPVDGPERRTQVGRSRSMGALLVIAVVVIAGLFWSLSQPIGDDDVAPATTSPATTSPATDIGTLPTFSPRADGAASVRARSAHQRYLDAVAPPLLDHPSGLSLLFASADGDLHVLDLDTGSSVVHESAGRPTVVIGSSLVVHHPAGPTRAVPLTDLGGDGTALGGPEVDGATASPGPSGDDVWLLRSSLRPTRFVWQLLSLDTAATVGELEATLATPHSPSALPSPSRWPGSAAGPTVTSSPAGGVWALGPDGGYERVADGSLAAVGDTHVVVQTCEQPAACTLGWLDRATWSPVPRPIPDEPLAGPALLVGGDRLLLYVGVDGPRLFDVANDRSIAFGEWSPWHLGASADGRYLAHTLGRPVIHDLDTGRSYRLDLPRRPADSPPLLVASDLLRSGDEQPIAATGS